jgi:cytochrome b
LTGRDQVSGEKSARFLACVLRDASVTTHIRVEGLVARAERVEQQQSHDPVVAFVVPLEQQVYGDHHVTCLFEDGAGYVAAGEERRSRNSSIDCG